jgi:DNA-binding beta-propeller fold protein YncE
VKSSIVMLAMSLVTIAGAAAAQPTRSSPLGVAPDGHVFVVNPDSNTVARLEFNAMQQGTLTNESGVGRYPRTLALAGPYVFTADQNSDTVSRLNQADLGGLQQINLGFGCNPYGAAPIPGGGGVLITCQGTSEAVLLGLDLSVVARIKLPWPNARAIAVSSNGGTAYITHYITAEPSLDAHVSVVDLGQKSVEKVLSIPADESTCETQNSGQGALNVVSAIALMPDGAPAAVANQLWVGGEQENNISKGLFKRWSGFANQPGSGMFPWVEYKSFPDGGAVRNIYKPSFHDIIRFGIYKVDINSGNVVGKIDVDEAANASDIELAQDGREAYVVDLNFNSYHIFNTARGQGGDPTTLFAPVSTFGPGGANSSKGCIPQALTSVTSEAPFRVDAQSQITTIDGYDPIDTNFASVNTGVEFDTLTYQTIGKSQMRLVPDGVGTAPIGVRLSPDGQTVYVANYLARNVVPLAAAAPLAADGNPANLRCAAQPTLTCGRNNDCPAGVGFCNHPGGGVCTTDADCGASPPCVRKQDCVPLVLGQPVSTITGGIAADPLPAAILDGKILFNTAGRDASITNGVGLGAPAPLFNDASRPENAKIPGGVVSTAHDASYVTCSTCHADFGGQDGRTWDFSQFGASLRNTMDLRGRPGFSPGTCSNDPSKQCFFDAGCGDGNVCKMNPQMIPPNIPTGDRDRYFNPMLTVHWNGDRDEVEDFEHTYRSLLGAGDCDAVEYAPTCQGALIQRSPDTSSDPADVNDDLGPPNRNIRGPKTGMNSGIRLTHMADFVYSLTDFVKNPNPKTAATERGRKIFNDPSTQCTTCHNGGPGVGKQFFTDKKPNPGFDPSLPGRSDGNNPFVRHDVGTANLFDETDPLTIAQKNQTYQDPGNPPDTRTIPSSRGVLGDYITPMLNDLWNTAPYLHDGSAHTLLDVIRPCNPALDDCLEAGRGRNQRIAGVNGQELHGATSFLTPQQLNDLVDFQMALTLDTVIGTNERVLNAGSLTLKKVVLTLPKQKKNGKTVGQVKVLATGTLAGADGTLDPTQGVTLSLAAPKDGQMMIAERTLTMHGSARHASGHDGGLSLVLRRKGAGFSFTAKGKGADVALLNTGNPDLTVAIEFAKTGDFAQAQFVQNRNLAGKKNVLTLPKNKKKKGHRA